MSTPGSAAFTLASRRLGALPLVTHFTCRIGLPGLLDRWVPPDDARLALDPATVLSAVVANLCTGHRPLYALGEWAAAYEPALLGLAGGQAGLLNDDRAGPDAGPAVPGRPGQPAHRADDRRDRQVRHRLLTAAQRLHLGQRAWRLPGRRWQRGGWHRHGGDHLGSQQGPPARPQAAGVHPDRLRRPRGPGHLPAGGREHQRRPHPHPGLGPAGEADRAHRFPLRRRLQARVRGGDAAHRPRRRPVHHRAAAQPQGGRRVPGLDARPPARLGRSAPRAGCPPRRPGPGVVSLRGALAAGGGIPDRVGPRLRQAAARRGHPRPPDRKGGPRDRGRAFRPAGLAPTSPRSPTTRSATAAGR